MQENVEAIRETLSDVVKEGGVNAYMVVILTGILLIFIATTVYFAHRNDQNLEMIIGYAVKEAKMERETKDELLRIQRDSLAIREHGQRLLEKNTKAMEDIRRATDSQIELTRVLIQQTGIGVSVTRKAAEAIEILIEEERASAKKDEGQ